VLVVDGYSNNVPLATAEIAPITSAGAR
jgi:hypothetical protein